MTARLDRYQQAHPRAGFPIAVVYKFADDAGGFLTAQITYYGFVSLFPLLLLLVTVLGFLLSGDPEAQSRVVGSALSQLPVVGDPLRENVRELRGSTAGLVVGILGSLYGGMGVGQAAQHALNTAWSVPRNRRPNPIKARLRSLGVVLLVGVGFVITTGLAGLVAGAGTDLGAAGKVLAVVLALAGNTGLFLLGYSLLSAARVPWRALVPGALAAAVAWQLVQSLGAYWFRHSMTEAGQLYGLFGFVLGLVAWLYAAALVALLGAEINVVRVRRLWPRALMTPFTDDVDLTPADEDVYASAAGAQRTKGFEQIDVTFDR